MPVSLGASLTACTSERVKAGSAETSSSSTSSGRRSLVASRQAAMCEAQQPRSPADMQSVLLRYHGNNCANRSVLHFRATLETAGGASVPSTAGRR
eukprot:CAMPEP_0171081624 /NCGR_PEP_ID=MMETSP0766_2-20121228/16625_1 /TAXON_ID=439317 /ORGANISM="Gambierdiscus australes, Strain CAWD 149" /LENGTH=95 /DNA_ID=CAMNT_0011538943 /DNA_START=345 /DNA_END=628 /DNA_ORIENTATION=-